MVFAVTHVILTIVLVDIFRHYLSKHKKKYLFPRWYLIVAGIGGLLPDIDIVVNWFYSNVIHGDFHLFWVGLVFFALAALFWKKKKHHVDWGLFFLLLSIGWMFHLFLDCLGGGYKFFLPFSDALFCKEWIPSLYFPHLDAVILLLWLIHEEWAKKIKDYF